LNNHRKVIPSIRRVHGKERTVRQVRSIAKREGSRGELGWRGGKRGISDI